MASGSSLEAIERLKRLQLLESVIPNQLAKATDLALIPDPSPWGEGQSKSCTLAHWERARVREYL